MKSGVRNLSLFCSCSPIHYRLLLRRSAFGHCEARLGGRGSVGGTEAVNGIQSNIASVENAHGDLIRYPVDSTCLSWDF